MAGALPQPPAVGASPPQPRTSRRLSAADHRVMAGLPRPGWLIELTAIIAGLILAVGGLVGLAGPALPAWTAGPPDPVRPPGRAPRARRPRSGGGAQVTPRHVRP